MRNTFFSLLAATTLFTGVTRGAEPSAAAQNRAVRFQREVRAALTKNGWHITEDDAGQLTAERLLIQSGVVGIVSSDTTFAHLAIRFRADTESHTASAATAARYIREYPDSPRVGRLVYSPLALRDPKLTQEYHDILAEADGQLSAGQSAHAITTSSSLEPASARNRIAMK